MKPQCQKILEHMEAHGSITDRDAFELYRIRRLASRIYDLKKGGYSIGRTMERGMNANGSPVWYARYFIQREASA